MSNKAQIITAPSGRGKTEFLINQLSGHINSLKGAEKFHPRKLLVVPYQEQAKRLRDLVLRRVPNGVLFSDPVISYGNFLKRLFPQVQGGEISEIQKRLILEEILETLPLSYYENARILPGFTNSLSGFIAEWKRLFLSEKDFDKAVKKFPPKSIQIEKFKDLKAVYQAYQNRLKTLGFSDFNDSFREVLTQPGAIETLKNIETLWFDGFYDFLPDQLKLLERIRRSVPETCVYLTHEEGPRKELFEITSATISKLKTSGFIFSGEAKDFRKNHRTDKPDLLQIEQALFSDKKSAVVKPENIQIYEGVGMRGEAVWIAREILRLKRSRDIGWSDMAVLFRNIGEYLPVLEEVFGEFGIPITVHERRKLRENMWARHLIEGLNILKDGLSEPGEFFDFLKSSYLPLSKETVLSFEEAAARQGFWKEPASLIRLLGKWLEGNDDEGAPNLQDFIVRLIKQAELFHKNFSLDEFSRLLQQSLIDWGGFSESDPEAARLREDFAAHRRIEKIVTEIRLNEEKRKKQCTFNSFLESLEKGIQMSLFSVPAASPDAVQAYSVQMARQKEYRIVFAGGLLQKNFPGMIREDTVLKDEEREVLSSLGLEKRLPRYGHERYYYYLALTRPSERLYLSYPRYDLEGKESLPSFFVDEVKKIFKDGIPMEEEKKGLSIPEPEKAVSVRDLENHIACELGERNTREVLETKIACLLGLYSFLLGKKAVSKIELPFQPGGKDVLLTDKKIKEGLKNKNRFSATALETFARCPFQYFSSKLLRLIEPKDYDSATEIGTHYHFLLSTLLPEFLKKHLSEGEIRYEIKERLAELEKYRLQPYEEKLTEDGYFKYIFKVLNEEAERLESSSYKPELFEETASFGKGEDSPQPPLSMQAGKQNFELNGEMDRVDIDKKTGQAVVVDYKTGRTRKLERKDIEIGAHLQLPLYGIALRELFKLKPVAYEIYSIKSAAPKSFLGRDKSNEQEIKWSEEKVREFAGEYVGMIRKGEFKALPKKDCRLCAFSSVCRYESWRKIYEK